MSDTSNDWVFSQEELQNSPSRKDGISWENEKAIRHNSCIFILEIGKHLRRGKTDNTAYIRDSAACILFHRFFTAQSFKSQNRLIVGAACVFLAGKIEGCFRHLSEIVKIYCKVRGMVREKESPSEAVLQEQQEMILVAERVILHTLSFDMHIEHHFKPLTSKIQTELKMYIPEDSRVAVMNSAICFIRDSFGTVLCLLYPARQRAAGALFMAILQLEINPQFQRSQQHQRRTGDDKEGLGKSWYELFKNDVKEKDLKSICSQIIEVYESKSWKPKSEAKTSPDINNLKSHLSTFFGMDAMVQQSSITGSHTSGDGDIISNSSSSQINNRKSDQITQPPQNVKKIETPVEKNRKNYSPSYENMNIKNNNGCTNDDDRDDDNVASRPPPHTQAMAETGSNTLAPPPTPDFLPPPPLPTPEHLPPPPSSATATTTTTTTTSSPTVLSSSSSSSTLPLPEAALSLPPPTPDYLPPPPMPSSSSSCATTTSTSAQPLTQPLPAPLPTPEYVPPPPMPPQQHQIQIQIQHQQPPVSSHTNGFSNGNDMTSSAPLVKTAGAALLNSKRLLHGNGNGYGHNSGISSGLTNGYNSRNININTNKSTCSVSSFVGSPPSYCSPPPGDDTDAGTHHRLEADEGSVSPKRPRLQYNCIQ